MWKWMILSLAGVMACPSPSECSKLPREATYHIFIHALHSGTNKISIEEKDNTLILKSVTHMVYEKSALDLRSRTIADAKTFRTISFEYEGTQNGKEISGFFSCSNDTIKGTFSVNGHEFPWKRAMSFDGIFAIQDYHFQHYMLLMKAYTETGEYIMRGEAFYPSSTMLLNFKLYTESERELPVGDTSLVCKKVIITLINTPPIISYIDPAEDLPLYIGFSATKTEAMLESYYGENPTPYYQRLDGKTHSDQH